VGCTVQPPDINAVTEHVYEKPRDYRYYRDLCYPWRVTIPGDFAAIAGAVANFLLGLADEGVDYNDKTSPGLVRYTVLDKGVYASYHPRYRGGCTEEKCLFRTKSLTAFWKYTQGRIDLAEKHVDYEDEPLPHAPSYDTICEIRVRVLPSGQNELYISEPMGDLVSYCRVFDGFLLSTHLVAYLQSKRTDAQQLRDASPLAPGDRTISEPTASPPKALRRPSTEIRWKALYTRACPLIADGQSQEKVADALSISVRSLRDILKWGAAQGEPQE
jgi:hypothetical protein